MYTLSDNIDFIVSRINAICDSMFDTYLYKYPNVVGLGLSMKNYNGSSIKYPALAFLVNQKLPKIMLSPQEIIPPTLDGIPTDVIESGELIHFAFDYSNSMLFPKSLLDTDSRNDLLQGGDSIGHLNSNVSGTIACAVEDSDNIYVLSSSHILSGHILETIQNNSPIISPSTQKGGTDSDIVGQLSRAITPDSTVENSLGINCNIVDAAIAIIGDIAHKDVILTDTLKKGVKGYEDITVSDVKLSDPVFKVGASTNETKGTVIVTNAVVKLTVNGQPLIYKHQILTTPMADIGDSGSLGLKANSENSSKAAFGLLMGGSRAITIYNPIQDVLKALNVDILV